MQLKIQIKIWTRTNRNLFLKYYSINCAWHAEYMSIGHIWDEVLSLFGHFFEPNENQHVHTIKIDIRHCIQSNSRVAQACYTIHKDTNKIRKRMESNAKRFPSGNHKEKLYRQKCFKISRRKRRFVYAAEIDVEVSKRIKINLRFLNV